MSEVKRKFATILATDCVSFSKHMAENEEATLSSLNSCRAIIDDYIEQSDHIPVPIKLNRILLLFYQF